MRRVKYFKYAAGRTPVSPSIREEVGEANFHVWGTDYEGFETGPGNYSTAIIELDNGEVLNIEVSLITFIKDQ